MLKDGGRATQLIFHLSHPRDIAGSSVNTNIPAEFCSVKYPDFNEAVQMCIKEGFSCKIGKSDMSSAFHHLGMWVTDFKWLIMKAKYPKTKLWVYFIDKCLPFGSSISCAHFQKFSDSVVFLVMVRNPEEKAS